MGYTHYFSQTRSFTDDEWNNIIETVNTIIKYCDNEHGIKVQVCYDDSAPAELTDEYILFNGVEDDGHESFHITKDTMEDFNFCKTARKPYDLVVVLSLLAIEKIAPNALEIRSDGGWEEDTEEACYDGGWVVPRKVYKDLFGEDAPLPASMAEQIRQH